MNNKLAFFGLGLIIFGIVNFLRYIPLSINLLNKPFPFFHIYDVKVTEGGGISANTLDCCAFFPFVDVYWIIWSALLYLGIGILFFIFFKKIRTIKLN